MASRNVHDTFLSTKKSLFMHLLRFKVVRVTLNMGTPDKDTHCKRS